MACEFRTDSKKEVVPHETVVSYALRYSAKKAASKYRYPLTTVDFWCDLADLKSSDSLPNRITSFLNGNAKWFEVSDAGVLDILQQINAMPPDRGHCDIVANKIYEMIDLRISKGFTGIYGNYIARMHADNIGWRIHIINVFVVRDEKNELMWHAVDKNTNSIIFHAHSKPVLLSRLKLFYHGIDQSTASKKKVTRLLAGTIRNWTSKQLPPWESDDEGTEEFNIRKPSPILDVKDLEQLRPEIEEDYQLDCDIVGEGITRPGT